MRARPMPPVGGFARGPRERRPKEEPKEPSKEAVLVRCSVEGCPRKPYSRGWCRRHYNSWYLHGDPLAAKTRGTYADKGGPLRVCRIVAAMPPPDDDSCYDWPYSCDSSGRACLRVDGVMRPAGQVVLETRGDYPPPGAEWALHSCDRPVCIAWWHLRWGTPADNARDMKLRKRGKNQYGRY